MLLWSFENVAGTQGPPCAGRHLYQRAQLPTKDPAAHLRYRSHLQKVIT